MEIGVIEAPTVKEMFIHRITDMIIKGELKPGDKLPSERELAQQSRISKSAVHLALADLDRMGFVETNARHGTYVCDFSKKGNIETLNILLKSDVGFMDGRRTADLLEMRMALEGTAIDRLCKNWTEETEEMLKKDIEESRSIVNDHGSVSDLAGSFFNYHHDICVASGNFILPLIFNTFEYVTKTYWEEAIRVLSEATCLKLEEDLYHLLQQQKAEEAKQYLGKEFNVFKNQVHKNAD